MLTARVLADDHVGVDQQHVQRREQDLHIERMTERRGVAVDVRRPLAVEQQRGHRDDHDEHRARFERRERQDQRGEREAAAQRVDLVPPSVRPVTDGKTDDRIGEHLLVLHAILVGATLVLVAGWVELVPPFEEAEEEGQGDANAVDEEREGGVEGHAMYRGVEQSIDMSDVK